ncbi:2'-5' RNA ligase family protein [Variovorax sp. NFACC27]|uniref:2'-5' RNA ligase family protein n=1 Tax=unclassified Variovorax TaxID=663243 RepID=UPI00089715F6|nr:2'-5' RNA ligase [Variovorax sp. NFACC28]SEG69606.1 2'-5' RNA ligase [Variovorax sp. NFACC29]SFC84146.1 2'-5' RNA ligase [Variovorax sp. NFACC26]SFF97646.1 2'-5' RNA ligase [Variovorax sp. NFACC27]
MAPALEHSLFFAIVPASHDATSIAALGGRMNSQHALKGTLVDAHRLHVTLFDLGGYPSVPADKVALASKAAASVVPPTFDIVFEKAMSYTKGALVLCADDDEGVSALKAFRQRLGEALADAGLKPPRSFTPHMTVAYARRKLEKHALEEPVRWTAASLVLIDSHVGEGVHEVLGRWPDVASGLPAA